MTSVTIPTSVSTIGSRAFYGCSSLTNVAPPEGVRDQHRFVCFLWMQVVNERCHSCIEARAFERCRSLTSVEIPASVTSIGPSAFYGCSNRRRYRGGLKGPFEAYNQFKGVPRALRAAPDAKTWARVQLWGCGGSRQRRSLVMVTGLFSDHASSQSGWPPTDHAGRTPRRKVCCFTTAAGRALAVHVWALEARPATNAFSLGFLALKFWLQLAC